MLRTDGALLRTVNAAVDQRGLAAVAREADLATATLRLYLYGARVSPHTVRKLRWWAGEDDGLPLERGAAGLYGSGV